MERKCSWTGSLNIIKMSSSPELIYKYNPVANKITAGSSVKIVNCQAESEIQQKQAKDLKWNFIRKDVLLINKQKIPKSFLSLKLDIREVKCKFKLQWLNISHPLSSLRFWKLTTSNVGKDVGEATGILTVSRNVTWYIKRNNQQLLSQLFSQDICPPKDLHTNIHSCFIYNSQQLETSQMLTK